MTFQDILKIFEENDNFLILTHKSPDGDTLGSGFALCAFLRDMGKKANVVILTTFPKDMILSMRAITLRNLM